MANLNRVLLMGNLTRDPELRYTPKGTAVADLGLAINRVLAPAEEAGERREETTFVEVTLWGRQAEVAQQYLTKGRSVFIEGRLQLESWEDKQTGQKRSKLKVVGEHLQLLPSSGGKGPAAQGAEAVTEVAAAPVPAARAAQGSRGPARPSRPVQRRNAAATRPQGPAIPADEVEVPF